MLRESPALIFSVLLHITVHNGAELKNKHICLMGRMVYFQPAEKKRVSHTHSC
jgi:hypothetical protein